MSVAGCELVSRKEQAMPEQGRLMACDSFVFNLKGSRCDK